MVSVPLTSIKALSAYSVRQLARLNIHTVEDALTYFPRGYQDRRLIPRIAALPSSGVVIVTGLVEVVSDEVAKNRVSVLKCRIYDSSGKIEIVFFNQVYLKTVLKPGIQVVCSGKIEVNSFTRTRQLFVSELDVIRSEVDRQFCIGTIVPIYPLVHGVYQSKIRHLLLSVVTQAYGQIDDPLPAWLLKKLNLMPLHLAIKELHIPSSSELGTVARQRIAFNEFLKFQLALVEKRNFRVKVATSVRLSGAHALVDRYLDALPYRLTHDQQSAIADVVRDITSGNAMNRLVQGDVGSGKTDVIAVTTLLAVGSGYQAALMVPTEVLAEQHFARFSRQLDAVGVEVVLLKGGQRSKDRKQALARLASGDPLVAVGTHALIEDPVTMPNLGLIVVDEQHRFGVMQRMKLNQKSMTPHCLFTTATPIPRSFMLAVFGDLDKSIIRELPPGRRPPETVFFYLNSQSQVWSLCREQLKKGRQVYVVYPLVEDSEKLDLASAIDGFTKVSLEFNDYSVGLVHGRMSGPEKTSTMAAFKAGNTQVLVSTTVIEVGIDVPNATVMVIVNAERFGLSQLHQLRGRVGRGADRSFCLLLGRPKSEISRKRIDAMVAISDGFELAELDLKLRGPGELLGTRQSGLPEFRVADLVRDQQLLELAHRAATHILDRDPDLVHPDHGALARWYRSSTIFPIEMRLN